MKNGQPIYEISKPDLGFAIKATELGTQTSIEVSLYGLPGTPEQFAKSISSNHFYSGPINPRAFGDKTRTADGGIGLYVGPGMVELHNYKGPGLDDVRCGYNPNLGSPNRTKIDFSVTANGTLDDALALARDYLVEIAPHSALGKISRIAEDLRSQARNQ